jgi:penicillin V acylase-like amidase (Ntn superfamily)
MWVLPRGMKRDGRGGKNTISWESKYGSLIVSAYDIGTAEGMNELSVSHKLALDTGLLMWQDSHRVGSGGGWRTAV